MLYDKIGIKTSAKQLKKLRYAVLQSNRIVCKILGVKVDFASIMGRGLKYQRKRSGLHRLPHNNQVRDNPERGCFLVQLFSDLL